MIISDIRKTLFARVAVEGAPVDAWSRRAVMASEGFVLSVFGLGFCCLRPLVTHFLAVLE
jgi:hypothetical protein